MTQFPHRDLRYRFQLAQGLVIEDCRRYTQKEFNMADRPCNTTEQQRRSINAILKHSIEGRDGLKSVSG